MLALRLEEVESHLVQGFYLLGGHAIYLDPKSIELGKREVRISFLRSRSAVMLLRAIKDL